LYRADIRKCCTPFIIGDAEVMRDAVKLTDLPFKIRTISNPSQLKPAKGCIEVLDIKYHSPFINGAPSKNAGRAVVSYIKKAVDLALNRVSALTAPISKESLKWQAINGPTYRVFSQPHKERILQ
jgi:4-hydroxythreonine-4-phosphate dehydrogenase